MEMALYHPQLGYHNSTENKIGADGDFTPALIYPLLLEQ
jgi:SAM-dependent MidA family methyltransferase